MKINLFFRNKNAGFSIGRVFEPISSELGKLHEVSNWYMPCHQSNVQAVLRNILYAKKVIQKNAINHITGDIYYLCWFLPRKNLVVTVHDIGFYTTRRKNIKLFFKYIGWILPLKRAEKVIFISETTKKVVLKHLKLREEQMEVIWNPVSSEYRKTDKRFNKDKPVILHLGMGIQKNLRNLIPALKGIACHLRLVGVLRNEYKQLLEEYKIEYSCVSNLTDKEVVKEYANCDIVNFISWHEGFGMPIVEGQASNKPVVTSNILPMAEIAGDGACLVDPYSQQEIRNAYKRIIEDDNYRESVRIKGYENSKRFNVTEIAKQYLYVYCEILNTQL
ncbi:MAG: glycosyltransferase family 4 protein [Bacteroidales bacterium]|jgi:glycosyltransferase involved in cell wall biosynthesis|nr:glycosyltransferase family 4 protein [Bacteroidales bacterium]